MSENTNYLGLCSNCKNASSCKFPRGPDKPSFYCEEFELEQPTPIRTARKEKPQATKSYVTKDEDSTEFIGLCSNCDNRRACTFLKPEGGVWHCEEYQ